MRRAVVVPMLVALLGLAGPTSADHLQMNYVRLVDASIARAPGTTVGPADLGDHYVVTLTLQNIGPAGSASVNLNDYWYVYDLPSGLDYAEVDFEPGETRTIELHARFDRIFDTPGPAWVCAEVHSLVDGHGGYHSEGECWSVWVGPMPDGGYPDDLPHPQGVPY
jgi:hypothetical protein